MTHINLSDLPLHKELIGQKINVTRLGGKYHYDYQDVPMMRVFTGAEIYTNKNREGGKDSWLRWNWIPEYDEETGKEDCGYSGIRMNNENFNLSYLEV